MFHDILSPMDEYKKTQDIYSKTDTNREATEVNRAVDTGTLTHTAVIPTPPPRLEEAVVNDNTAQQSDRNYLVAVLLAVFAPYGLTRLYTGHKDGVFRIYWFLILIVLFFLSGMLTLLNGLTGVGVSLLVMVGGLMLLSLPVLYVWGLIDFLLSLFRKTDAKGLPLQASERDKKWAKTIFYTIIGIVVAYVVMMIVSIASIDMSEIDSSLPSSIPWNNI